MLVMKCKYCGKEFELNVLGGGGQNRQFCYECYPESLEKPDRDKLRNFLNIDIYRKQKIERGCDKCGYNQCADALEWHHDNDNKDYNPSELLKDNKIEEYLKEIQKCRLLCVNCHREEHFKNKTSHKDFLQLPRKKKNFATEQDIIDKYYELKTYKGVANYFSCSEDLVSKICKSNQIQVLYKQSDNGQKIAMLDKDNNNSIIQIFNCIQEAYNFLGKQQSGHIASVCKGNRKSAYGYGWKYI